MEEKLSDRICKEAFREYYLNGNFEKSLELSKKAYRLLMKNTNQNSKDNYYIWMVLMTIVKSYDRMNDTGNVYKYILLSLRYCGLHQSRKIDSLYYLVKYYVKTKDNTKADYYFNECTKSCYKIGEYSNLIRLMRFRMK